MAHLVAVIQVDDAAQGVTDVVRGADRLASTPRQLLLYDLLGLVSPRYAHVPLVLGPDGQRLAKRHGAVTFAQLAARGLSAAEVLARIGASLDLCSPTEAIDVDALAGRFAIDRVPRTPWQFG